MNSVYKYLILFAFLGPVLVACGGSSGGGVGAGTSDEGMADMSGTNVPPLHPNIPWLLDKSALQLNAGSNTNNVVLDSLPDNSAVRAQLKAESEKASPDANFYYNFSTIFGKYEGRAAAGGNSAIAPGEWTLESDCSEAGRCTLISDTEDDYHVVTADGFSPYFVGEYDRNEDNNIGPVCDGTNAAICERKTESSVVIRPVLSDGADYEPIMMANDVAMVQARGTGSTASSGTPFDFLSYGAWMEHSGFFAKAYLYDLATGRSQENAAWTLGITTGSNPAPQSGQTLAWNGVMVGMAGSHAPRQAGDPYDARDFDPIQGDATITVSDNGGNLEIGVAFTDIFYLNSANTNTIQDITWTNSQIVSGPNGRFTSTQHNLKAAFYGPNHEEVAGTYEKVDGTDFLVGAFGAKQ